MPTGGRQPSGTVAGTTWRAAVRPAPLGETVALLLFTLWTAWPFLQPNRLVMSFDTITYAGPNTAFTSASLRAGHLPTWNDGIFGGIPHLANPNAQALYPLKWLLAPLGPERAIGVVAALHLLLLAVGCLALARQLRWRPPAGLVLGVVLVGCGSTMTKAIQTEQLAVLAWAPLLLWAVDRVLVAPRPARAVAAMGAIGALMLVAGHPQMLFVLGPVVAAWALARMLDGGHLRRWWLLAGAGALAVGLAGVQLLPTAALLGQTVSSVARPVALAGDPAYTAKPSLVAGNVLGDVTERNQAALGGTFEANLSVGAAAAALVVLALVLAARRRDGAGASRATVALMASVAGGAWVLALGPRTALYRVAADVVPGFSQARVPGRWLVATSVALAVLAGYAVDQVASGGVRRRQAAQALGALTLLAAIVWAGAGTDRLLLPPAPAARTWVLFAGLVVVGVALKVLGGRPALATLGVVLLGAVPVLELGLATRYELARVLAVDDAVGGLEGPLAALVAESGDRVVAITYDRFDDTTYLVESLRPNANVLFGVRSIDGYDGGPQLTLRWIDTMRSLAPSFNRDLTLRAQGVATWPPALLARFGVRWAMVDVSPGTPPPGSFLPGWTGPVARDGVLELWENPAWQGEAVLRVATTASPPEDAGAALRAITDAGDPAAVVDPDGTLLTCSQDCQPVAASVARPSAGHLRVVLDAPRPGLLVVAEQWAPGWTAHIDGDGVPVEPADGMFLAVSVPAGRHVVALRYEAPGLRAGLALSGAAASVLVGLVLWGPRLRPRGRSGVGQLADGEDGLAEGRPPTMLEAP